MNLDLTTFQNCHLCPRDCGVDRLNGQTGFCGETADLRIATIEPHFGEEPPFSGNNGSGTVFFSGCSLKCDYCQNHQISIGGMGNIRTVKEVVQQLNSLARMKNIHNINFVSPDHYFPHCIQIVDNLRSNSIKLPVLFNLSGYQKIDILQSLESHADIYLPDYKYSNSQLAQAQSQAPNYPIVALDALSEMVKQKGFLNSFKYHDSGKIIATRGVLVRHLILPGHVNNSIDALTSLFLEFGSELPLSLMSQYSPIKPNKIQSLNRCITTDEFARVYEHIQTLGFNNLFIQFPESTNDALFLPNFKQTHPFKGNTP